jgi:hypothetical protein
MFLTTFLRRPGEKSLLAPEKFVLLCAVAGQCGGFRKLPGTTLRIV